MKGSIIIWISLVLALILIRCEKETNGLPMDGDGNRYDTIVFGEQTWLTENLKTTKYINGDPIRLVTDDSEWSERTQGAYCWYENNINFKDIYGALYNGYVAKASNFICPTGYHVPTIEEWMRLVSYLDVSSNQIKQSFKIQGIGFRLGDGPFYANGPSWWSSSTGYPNTISSSFVTGSSGYQKGLFIRCIKNN